MIFALIMIIVILCTVLWSSIYCCSPSLAHQPLPVRSESPSSTLHNGDEQGNMHSASDDEPGITNNEHAELMTSNDHDTHGQSRHHHHHHHRTSSNTTGIGTGLLNHELTTISTEDGGVDPDVRSTSSAARANISIADRVADLL
jgi:hypothetical protein